MTALYKTGDGAAAFERRLTDARIEMYRLDGSVKGLEQVFAGFGITEDEATGTETSTNETDAMLLPSRGEATVTVNGGCVHVGFPHHPPADHEHPGSCRAAVVHIQARRPPTKGIDVSGILGRVDLEKAIYKEMYWGGASGTTPVPQPAYGSISFKFEAAEEAETGTPYSVEFVLPRVELRMGNFQSRGQDLIRFDIQFMMIDDVTTPLTINIVNKVATQY